MSELDVAKALRCFGKKCIGVRCIECDDGSVRFETCKSSVLRKTGSFSPCIYIQHMYDKNIEGDLLTLIEDAANIADELAKYKQEGKV